MFCARHLSRLMLQVFLFFSFFCCFQEEEWAGEKKKKKVREDLIIYREEGEKLILSPEMLHALLFKLSIPLELLTVLAGDCFSFACSNLKDAALSH